MGQHTKFSYLSHIYKLTVQTSCRITGLNFGPSLHLTYFVYTLSDLYYCMHKIAIGKIIEA